MRRAHFPLIYIQDLNIVALPDIKFFNYKEFFGVVSKEKLTRVGTKGLH